MPVSKEVTLKLVWDAGSTKAVEDALDKVKDKLDKLKDGGGGGTGVLAGLDKYGPLVALVYDKVVGDIGKVYSFVKTSVVDTVGLLKSVGGTIFNLLAAPWRQFYDFFYRFIRWQITWGLIGLGAATEEFVRRSVSAFTEYELTVTKAVTTTGLLGAAAAAAKAEFMALGLQMSMRSMLSATDIAKQFYWLTSAGLTVPQARQVTPGVVALAQATQADPAATSALVVSSMAAFHLQVDQTNRVVNTFAANIGTTLLTLDTLATALPYVGASAYQAGLSFETTNAAIGLLANNGLRASRMGTGLRGMFAALMAPTREAQGILAKYGLSARDVNIQSEGLYNVLDRLAPIIKNQGDMYALMGRRTTEAANILVSQRKELWATEQAITGTNRAYEMQDQILSTLAGQWAMLKNVGLSLMIQFGGGLAQGIKPWVTFLRDFGENLFGTGKAGQLGEKLGQWISAQLTKVGKWILSGDAAKWWDRLVAGAKMFWSVLVGAYHVLGQVYAILKGLNTPENQAFFVAMKDWAVGLVTSGVTTVLGIMAAAIERLPAALQFALDIMWKLLPMALAYARVWVVIAALKANVTGLMLTLLGAFVKTQALNPVMWGLIGGGPKGVWKAGEGIQQAGRNMMGGSALAGAAALGTIQVVQDWLTKNPVPPKLGDAIIAAHAAGGEKVASAIEKAFGAAAGGGAGVGATAMAAATGGAGTGGVGGYMGGGEGHWAYQYLGAGEIPGGRGPLLRDKSGRPYKRVWVPAQRDVVSGRFDYWKNIERGTKAYSTVRDWGEIKGYDTHRSDDLLAFQVQNAIQTFFEKLYRDSFVAFAGQMPPTIHVEASPEFKVRRAYEEPRGAKPGMGGRAKSF